MSATLTPELRCELIGKAQQIISGWKAASEPTDSLIDHFKKSEIPDPGDNEAKAIVEKAVSLNAPAVPEAEFIDPLPEVPTFLKTIPNWIRWRLETGDNGKPTKVPYRVDGRKAA